MNRLALIIIIIIINTRRAATDHHGNVHAVCRSAREFPGSCDFSSSETSGAQTRVFAGSAAAT